MSEHHRPSPEQERAHIEHEREREPVKETEKPTEQGSNKEPGLDSLETIKRSIEEHAKSAAETSETEEADKAPRPTYLTKELKQEALAHTLKRVRQNLSPLNRTFSKITHSKPVNAISEASGKTIGRPSGVLGGALVASFGSLSLLTAAKHYGFRYNYGVILWLFLVGFGSGLIIEFLLRLNRRLKR